MSKEEAEEIIHKFGWCGCGAPDLALEVVRDMLYYYSLFWENIITYQEREDALTLAIPSVGAQYIVLYLLDHHGLMEHGGSVAGGWLTEKGYAFLGALLQYENLV